MNSNKLLSLLDRLKRKKISPQKVYQEIKKLPYQDLGFAKIDYHREIRRGFPEVVFCQGKSKDQILKIILKMNSNKVDILATRANQAIYNSIKKKIKKTQFNSKAKIISIKNTPATKLIGNILIVTAGTADIPVAEEAFVTANFLGNNANQLLDVGVAGLHRLLSNLDKLYKAKVIIVIAGMEGALTSVIAGLVDKPVIAVPTSVGYGANFKGLSALLGMLNSCSPGVGVVNIDNGFGAACLASIINKL